MFDLISSEYNWDDEVILNKTLRRLRQIVAVITERKLAKQKEERLILSWQTRSLAMVVAAAGSMVAQSNGAEVNDDLMKFAANLTIDSEEYKQFGASVSQTPVKEKVPVHATTQEDEARKNFEAAAERNSTDLVDLFGTVLERSKPGE